MITRLNCRKATPLIWERAAGDLAGEQAAALEAHLEQCARCREESRRAERAFQLLAVIDQPVELRAGGWDRLYRRITTPVAPLWRRLTAPALTSAAVTAVTLLVALGQFANVSPGPRGVVVIEAQSKPLPLPNVRIANTDGSFEATWLPIDDPTGGLPMIERIPTIPEPDEAKKIVVRRHPTKAAVGPYRKPPVSAPVHLTATPIRVVPAKRSFAGATVRAPVDYHLDPYTGDIIGRPVNDTGV